MLLDLCITVLFPPGWGWPNGPSNGLVWAAPCLWVFCGVMVLFCCSCHWPCWLASGPALCCFCGPDQPETCARGIVFCRRAFTFGQGELRPVEGFWGVPLEISERTGCGGWAAVIGLGVGIWICGVWFGFWPLIRSISSFLRIPACICLRCSLRLRISSRRRFCSSIFSLYWRVSSSSSGS